MSQNIDLGIVIPTFNRKAQVRTLVAQLQRQELKNVNYKIIVVVDGSTDGTIETLKSDFPDVAVVEGNGNWWFTRSLNEGCKYAINTYNPELILTLNDDVQLPGDYLQQIIRNYYESGGDVVIGSSSYSMGSPRMITFSGIERRNSFLLKYYKYIQPYTLLEPGSLRGTAPSVTLPTRGLLVPANLMVALDYLDEKQFPQYSSDYDFVLRCAKSGVKVLISYDAYVFEDMRLTSAGNPRLTKSLNHFIKNVFFNKYSSNYFFKDVMMAWRYGKKILFPFYCALIGISIPYIFLKYKFLINNKFNK